MSVLEVDPRVVCEIPARVATHYPLMPVGWQDGRLRVAITASLDAEILHDLHVVLQRDIQTFTAPEEAIRDAIKAHYGIGADTLERLSTSAASQVQHVALTLTDIDGDQDASVMKFVNQMLLEAYQTGATDIHLEPSADDLRVRTRIDGILYEARIPDSLKRFQSAITSRIKIMADLSIAEKRLPQDGRMIVRVEGREMDLRVSTLPTPFGESVGIRLLTSRQFLDLQHLGFADRDLARLESYLHKPHGIVFLTGPTGSGKTTTLYAFLKKINRDATKIITLEDPIEYQMKGITQVQVQPTIGLTFASGLRAMLRHDPDVMMIGEVRDFETAEIAIRVSLTGHLVFSTLHTNDAAGAVTRLQDIGVEPYLISSSILCVIAQRLVRVICKECRYAVVLPRELHADFGLPVDGAEQHIFSGQGCTSCKGTGYRGRTVIYEMLPISSAIQDRIVKRAHANEIRDQALAEGMRTLRQCGWEKIKSGMTTPEEVLRVTLQETV